MTTAAARRTRIALILVVAALPRIWAAVWDQGIFWPDEIFQSTEPAHNFAFGYGYVAWEFQDGARSWLFPGAIGLGWKLLSGLGVSAAPTFVISAKLAMAALALVGIHVSMRIAEKIAGSEAAVLCGLLGAAFPPSIVYGSRCMTEMASAPLVALAVLLTMDRDRAKLISAGCLAGLMVYLRVQNGLIAVALLGWLLAQRRGRDAGIYAIGAAVGGLAGGLLDLFTWGTAFHSFITNVRFNLIEGRSAEYGVESAWYYATVFWSAAGVSSVGVLLGLAASARREVGLFLIVLLFAAAHTAIPHKEFRFLMPIVPLMLALSSVGLVMLIGRVLHPPEAGRNIAPARPGRSGRQRASRKDNAPLARKNSTALRQARPAVWIVGGVLAAAMGWHARYATFDDLGQYEGPLSGPQPVWHRFEDINRLLWAAGQQPDLCGLALVEQGPVWSGGYTYLHRDVPIIWMTTVEPDPANYVLAHVDVPLPAEYTIVKTIGEGKLARRPGSCGPPPPAYTRLFPK